MNSMIAVRLAEEMLSPVIVLTNEEAAERFASITEAMAALHIEVERCTDPRTEKCLLTLLMEREVEYLEVLSAWEYEDSIAAAVR